MLINIQVSGNISQKSPGLKLCLAWKFHRSFSVKRQIYLLHKLRRKAKSLQSLHLPLYFLPVCQSINKGILFLKITLCFLCQLPVFAQSPLVGVQILKCLLFPLCTQQLFINQPVLRGNLCRCITGNPSPHSISLHKHIIHSCLLQEPGAKYSAQTAANNQHIRLYISLKLRKRGKFHIPFPD